MKETAECWQQNLTQREPEKDEKEVKEQREAKRRTGGNTDSSSGIFSEAVDAQLGEEPASSPPSSCRRSDRSRGSLLTAFQATAFPLKCRRSSRPPSRLHTAFW